MFFFYSGDTPLDVLVPGEQYAITVLPSARSQRTTNQSFYDFIFSDEFKHKALFEKTSDFEPPVKKPVATPAQKKESAKAEGGPE